MEAKLVWTRNYDLEFFMAIAACNVPFAPRSLAAMSSGEGGGKKRRVLPEGVWPTMITPFLRDERKSVDWNGIDSELDQSHCSQLQPAPDIV